MILRECLLLDLNLTIQLDWNDDVQGRADCEEILQHLSSVGQQHAQFCDGEFAKLPPADQ